MLETVVLLALSLGAEERTLRSALQESGRTEVTASGMTVIRSPQTHVLVARIGSDGELSTQCAAGTEENAAKVLSVTEERKDQ